jgi:hypothetical protein
MGIDNLPSQEFISYGAVIVMAVLALIVTSSIVFLHFLLGQKPLEITPKKYDTYVFLTSKMLNSSFLLGTI